MFLVCTVCGDWDPLGPAEHCTPSIPPSISPRHGMFFLLFLNPVSHRLLIIPSPVVVRVSRVGLTFPQMDHKPRKEGVL